MINTDNKFKKILCVDLNNIYPLDEFKYFTDTYLHTSIAICIYYIYIYL